MKTKYLILGAGPTGTWAIKGIRQEDQHGEIIIVGDQPYPTYSLPLLTKGYIQGQFKEEDLYLVNENFFEINGTMFLKGKRGIVALPKEGKVVLDDETEITYKKLLISTGGRPSRLKVSGGGLSGIYYLRTLGDSNEIKKAAEKAKQALVIGGSFIGVELAVALRQIGLPVKLIMLEKYVWQSLLPEGIGNYLMDKLIAGGVEIYPEEKVVEFEESNGWVKAVKPESGKTFEADLVGVGVGLTLNVELLNGTEVKIGRGIQVNEFLETNVKGIHAAGDVAEFDDLILGMKHVVGHIENAQLQGKTVGRNMAGAKIPYAEVTGYDSGIFDMPLIFIGALECGKEHWIRGEGGEPSLGSFAVRDGRVVGVFLIKPKGKEIKAVRELIKIRDIDMKRYEDELRNHTPDLAAFVKNLTRGS